MSKDANLELEKFREQWREEVIARSKGASTAYSIKAKQPVSTTPATTIAPDKRPLIPNPDASIARGNEDEDSSGHAYHDLEDQDEASRLGESGKGSHPSNHTKQEPQSALEHYEKAVERESQGNLGDSLSLYRKAYRVLLSNLFQAPAPADDSLARLTCRQGLQKQTLPTLNFLLETYRA